MTADELKQALSEGTEQHVLVLRLIDEGYDDASAWSFVRAAGLVNMSEELARLTASAPTADGENYEASDARMIMLASRMSVDAAELLKLISAPPRRTDAPA